MDILLRETMLDVGLKNYEEMLLVSWFKSQIENSTIEKIKSMKKAKSPSSQENHENLY